MSTLDLILALILPFLFLSTISFLLICFICNKIELSRPKNKLIDCSDIEKRVIVLIIIIISILIFFAYTSFIMSKYLDLNVDSFSYRLLIGIYLNIVMILGLIIVFIISIIVIVKCCNKKWFVILFSTIVFVALLSLSFKNIVNNFFDYKIKDFISYSGKFEVVNQGWKSNYLFLNDKTQLHSLPEYYESGDYYGEILYAKRSKIVLSISTDG